MMGLHPAQRRSRQLSTSITSSQPPAGPVAILGAMSRCRPRYRR
jgi:hypothetical protein